MTNIICDTYDNEIVGDEWERVLEDLAYYLAGKTCILRGVVGRWNGACEGGAVFDWNTEGEQTLARFFKDCDYIKVWEEEGEIRLKGTHHDGTNTASLRPLAEDYTEVDECKFAGDQQYHEFLWAKYTEEAVC